MKATAANDVVERAIKQKSSSDKSEELTIYHSDLLLTFI